MRSTADQDLSSCLAPDALSPEENALIQEIRKFKSRLNEELLLLSHHYQRPEIAALADRVGDSYELSRAAAQAKRARFIVFCGVRFMAEAAEILRRENQRVIHPAPEAGCPMADMATVQEVKQAWERIAGVRGKDRVMPLLYINSSAALKAVVGELGGTVCTSSNAARAFAWGLARREAVLFLPDEHLGRNTARATGLGEGQVVLWNRTLPDGGIAEDALKRAKAILWNGHCHVHTAFTVEDILRVRKRYPGGRVLVHPECREEVVKLADAAGSTSFLVKAVQESAPGSVLIIGTEINLVSRLAKSHPDRTVVPLKPSLCHNMFRLSPRRLLEALRALPGGEAVTLSAEIKDRARLALERMLSI